MSEEELMKNIKVIVTAAGCPGASTFIHWLKEKVTERRIEIVGVDMDKEAIGRFLAHKFHVVPAANSPDYIPAIHALIKSENPDIFFCVSTPETPVIAKHKVELEALGTKVIVSDPESVRIAENKYLLYSALKNVEGVRVPDFRYPRNLDEFVQAAKDLGYPKRRVCFKPHVSKGSRGYRIIDDTISRKDLLLNYKPDSLYISMQEIRAIFECEPVFPDLLVMEFVEGEEIDAMTLSHSGEALLVTCKTRESSRAGVVTRAELVSRPELVTACNRIIKKIPLNYNSGMQFKGGRLIEINTRVSTFIYQDDMIEPYLSIKLALGEISHEEVRAYQSRIQFGRRMIRYMDQVFFRN